MKKFVKILSLIAAVALVLTCAACGAAKTNSDSDTAKKLVMGTNASFPPYEFVDDNNKIVGIDAEIAAAVEANVHRQIGDGAISFLEQFAGFLHAQFIEIFFKTVTCMWQTPFFDIHFDMCAQ